MQLIGFNFNKIIAEKKSNFTTIPTINTNIEFLDVTKEEVAALNGLEVIKIVFEFVVSFETDKDSKDKKAKETKNLENKIILEGNILLSVTSEESKNILKSWKKKEMPEDIRLPLFNIILKKCTPKALNLEDELGLPPHFPIPQLQKPSNNQQEKDN